MRKNRTSGSVGRAPGNRCLYPDADAKKPRRTVQPVGHKKMNSRITCNEPSDLSPAIQYLRTDLLANVSLLESIERNIPPVPCRVLTATDATGRIAGVMIVHQFAHGTGATLRASTAEAVPVLVAFAGDDETIGYTMPVDLRTRVLEEFPDAAAYVAQSGQRETNEESVTLALKLEDIRTYDYPGEIRRLRKADKAMLDQFPPPSDGEHGHAPLMLSVEWAEGDLGNHIVFGIVREGHRGHRYTLDISCPAGKGTSPYQANQNAKFKQAQWHDRYA